MRTHELHRKASVSHLTEKFEIEMHGVQMDIGNTCSVVWCPYLTWINSVFLYSSPTLRVHRTYHRTINSDNACFYDWGFSTIDLFLYLNLDPWIANVKSATPLKLKHCISWAKIFSFCNPVRQVYITVACSGGDLYSWWTTPQAVSVSAGPGALGRLLMSTADSSPLIKHCQFNTNINII